jgi:omega-hydroxy-beta-dihydromenaquinone-9 sulfotransferase
MSSAPHRDNGSYASAPTRSFNPWTPRFWHGMGFGTWLRLLVHNRFAVSPSRWPIAASITLTSALNSFSRVFEQLMWSHLAQQTKLSEPPLLVIGHWRSGTTLLHELLVLDPQHTYPNTYQCFEPMHFLWTEWFVPSLTRWSLPEKRPMDDMQTGWERPQEDEFALVNLGLPSPYLAWAFPNHGPMADDYLDLQTLSETQREEWKRKWFQFVQKVALRNPGRIVLKSPTHTARVKTILEVFPDARFVHIVRDPLALFPSTVRLWRSLSEVQGMQTLGDAHWIERHVLDTFVRMYERFEQDRELIPAGRLCDVRYESLVADPVGQMREVYRQLDLGDFTHMEGPIAEYELRARNYRTNEYAMPADVSDRVRRRWAPYFQRYGYIGGDLESVSA